MVGSRRLDQCLRLQLLPLLRPQPRRSQTIGLALCRSTGLWIQSILARDTQALDSVTRKTPKILDRSMVTVRLRIQCRTTAVAQPASNVWSKLTDIQVPGSRMDLVEETRAF